MELFLRTLPIFLLILLGYILKRMNILNDHTSLNLEKLTYFVLLPVFIFYKSSHGLILGATWLPVILAILYTLTTTGLVLMVWQKVRSGYSDSEFTSIFQGSVRSNPYITLGVVQAMFGAAGLDIAVIMAGVMTFLTAVLSILIFYAWGKKSSSAYKALFWELAYNPLIICFIFGVLLAQYNVELPDTVDRTLKMIGSPAIPLGLIIVGASLFPKDLQSNMWPFFFTSLIQFAWKPALAFAILSIIGQVPPLVSAVLVMMFASPASSISYLLAKDLEGNKSMINSIVTLQTMVAFLIIPLIAIIILQ